MVCDVVEIASGVPLVWARRDGAGVPVAGVAVSVSLVASTGASLLPCVSDMGSLESVTFELVVSSTLSVSLDAVSVCACCAAVD